jgi:hypothetical protein
MSEAHSLRWIVLRRRFAAALGRLQLLAGALCCIAGCTDTAVVGVNLEQADSSTPPGHDGCEPACDHDELCHPELHICVNCIRSNDCTGDTDAPFCDPVHFRCVQCRSSADCYLPAPRCDQGVCRSCEEPPNCVGEYCAHTDDACRFDNRGPGSGSGTGGSGGRPH